MSKIAEKRTNEIIGEFHDGDYTDHSRHNTQWVAFKQGYDQALKDMVRDAEKFQYLSDEVGFAYACGCKKTMQDFLEKACEWLSKQPMSSPVFWTIEDFKKYMEEEL